MLLSGGYLFVERSNLICCCRLAYFLLPWFVEPNFTEGAMSEWSLLWVEVEPDLGERGSGVADSHGEVCSSGAAARRTWTSRRSSTEG